MLGLAAGIAPAAAANPPELFDEPAPSNLSARYDAAVDAYERGDYASALSSAKLAALEGDAEAQLMVGTILRDGLAGSVDRVSAVDWFKKSAAQLNSDAMLALGGLAVESEGGLVPSDALHWFSMAAQSRRPEAMRAIGEMYVYGKGIEADPQKGREWLQKASDMGDNIAARKIADSFFDEDPAQALSWYQHAARGGDHEAAYIAAIMYEENFDIRPDTHKMAELMQQAAESGMPAAQADYGLLVYQGRGVERDIDKAADWFEKAALNGDPEGQFLYAFTLAKGEGVEQSFENAYYWLLKSGESDVSAYDKDRDVLRERLENNVSPAILDRAKQKWQAERPATE